MDVPADIRTVAFKFFLSLTHYKRGMGANVSSTISRIEQAVENQLEITGSPTAKVDCQQKIKVTVGERGLLKNCSIVQEQDCRAYASADINTLMSALQTMGLDNETEQQFEGLVLGGANVNVNDQDLKTSVLNSLKATCEAEGTTDKLQDQEIVINGTYDCTGGNEIRLTQFGDATANCVMKQIVEAQQDTQVKNKLTQTLEGIDLAACGGVLIGLAFLGVIGAFIKSQMKGKPRGRSRGYPSDNNLAQQLK